MNWQVFASIYDLVEQPLLDQVNTISDRMLAAIAQPLNAALTVYVALLGVSILAGHLTEPVRDTWWRIAKAALIAGFLTAGTYNSYVRDFFLNGLPNDLTSAITGASGTVNAQSFDHLWNKAFGGGWAVWKNLSWTDFGLQFLVVVYWFAVATATAFGFLVWMTSRIFLGLYVAVGPLLLGCLLFPATRALAERWIGAMLSMILLQVFVIALLVVLTGAENALLANISDGGGNPIAQVQILFGCIILFVIAAVMVVQLPGAAAAIAGGLHFHAGALAGATFGAGMGLAGQAADAGRRVAGEAGRAAQGRLTAGHPPGPSMSSGASQ